MDRRQFLISSGVAAAALAAPTIVTAKVASERRFVFIIQRGAADGLNIVMPMGDPAFATARGALAIPGGTKLDGMFTLHPALAETARMYADKQALFAHAVASPYRDRSHFDGQNVLETGGNSAYQLRDGWLNRLLTRLPRDEAAAIAVSATVPVALRGKVEVASFAPSSLPQASDDLLARVTQLYTSDSQLHPLWSSAMATRQQTSDLGGQSGANAAATGALAAKLLTGPDSARIAMIETGGWDTHSGQAGRLAAQLKGLDAMVAALRTGLDPAWNDTLVLIATEFGRTVAVNGTGGTDHGTGSAAMLLGGAVSGGRVLADWPGLSQPNLYEGRDLKPTLGLDALIASALGQHYGLDPALLAKTLFPDAPFNRYDATLVRT
jgi:uncharacterized protein (DUF1501 family)